MNYLKLLFKTEDRYDSLLLRLSLGLVMFPHGAQKVFGWFGGHGLEGTMGFFTQKMGLPTVIALLVIAIEFFGALGLIAGFLTRLCAAGVAAVMAGAVMTVHLSNGFFMNWSGNQAGEGFEYHILAIGIAFALMLTGGGKFSLDRWIDQNHLRDDKTGTLTGAATISAQQ